MELECGENEWLHGIRSQTDRLGKLTDDLIRLSRTEEDSEIVRMIEFPLSELIKEASEAFYAPAKAQNRELRLYIQPDVSMKCHGDSLRRLICVLLDNALKYSPEGSVIRLWLQRRGRSVVLRVENESRDSLSPEQLDRLFDRFYRADASRSSRTEGYGIGLSIAAAIVSAHKGKISAEIRKPQTMTIMAVFPA